MGAELLAQPEVVKAIARVLRAGGVRGQELPDAVAEIQVRVLHSLRHKPELLWPQTEESWKGLAIRATQTFLKDRHKMAKRRAKSHVGLEGEPDEHADRARRPSARDPVDLKLAMGVLDAHLAESETPELDLEIVDRLSAGQDQAKIAGELGLSHQKIRDRVRAIRKSFRRRLAAVVGAAAAAGFALLLVLRAPGEPRKTQLAGAPRPHGADAVLVEASPTELAAQLRDEARAACRSAQWGDCLTLLDDARQLDPAGDQAPEIQAARDVANQALDDVLRRMEAKPPQTPRRP